MLRHPHRADIRQHLDRRDSHNLIAFPADANTSQNTIEAHPSLREKYVVDLIPLFISGWTQSIRHLRPVDPLESDYVVYHTASCYCTNPVTRAESLAVSASM